MNAIEDQRGAWPNLEGPRNSVYIETRRISMNVPGRGGERREGKERKSVVSRRDSIPPSIDSTAAEAQLYPRWTRLRSLLFGGYVLVEETESEHINDAQFQLVMGAGKIINQGNSGGGGGIGRVL